MSPKQSIWYRIGYAFEKAKDTPPSTSKKLRSLADRVRPSRSEPENALEKVIPSVDGLLSTGATAAAAKLLTKWQPRGKTGLLRLVRAGAAGAAAAILVDMVRPLLLGAPEPDDDDDASDRILAGVGQGLIYGGVVEPRMPGGPLLKGAVYGSAEYAVDAAGGLSKLLGGIAPHKRLPVVGSLFDDLDAHDRAYLEHVVFGVALALLYGTSPSSNGILPEDDGE